VLIANALGAIADDIFSINDFHRIDTATAWTGALAYTFQIYFDFSGYSDMALGLGQIMGFSLPENFNNPYTATSITDFWRRWHMTLGAWMRNYLYIPLGGNRTGSNWRLYFNLWIVFVASGLWHGAAWAFLIWGMYHGLFLVLERAIRFRPPSLGGVLPVVYSFVVVAVGWVFFRLEAVEPSIVYLSRMFQWYPANHLWFPEADCLPMFIIAGVFSFFTLAPAGMRVQQHVYYNPWGNKMHIFMTVITLVLLALCAFRITSGDFNPFIYFRF
jgi:alginate O-acetyltransferase complex protein AlgI